MKKFSLVLAMLAVVLVFGLVFLGCGGDSGPKDIETLFDSIKNVGNLGSLYASDSNNNSMYWCRDHNAWHPRGSTGIDHNAPAPFRLSQATRIGGDNFYRENTIGAANARDVIKKLDSFFSSKYKRNVDPYRYYPTGIPDGDSVVTWFAFSLRRSGEGTYGSSAVQVEAPLWIYYYQFD